MALSPAIERAEKIQRLLQDMGLEVSRHASSMLVLAQGLVAASIHVYPEDCVINLYTLWGERLHAVQSKIVKTVQELCGKVEAYYAPRLQLGSNNT